ncbi:hypothetical protein N7466_000565 [Penicillium verhagenii]|uniref:uncharacterized protein n=1 Tax=Penicillium verhagenii TaxID=1562060 RepID=UPI00254548BC|nr:uncharacterized protein N7466_000565 [Penicillium verhagenii]KAJ5947550.1 hypothetical protein N7466_000565 [Penicillium verhagenii]
MTTAQHMPAKAYSTDNVHHRPKGILKNSRSFQHVPISETVSAPPVVPSSVPESADTKELTLQNTLQNAGPRRRSSSGTQGSASRRQSEASMMDDDNSPRLKWDEANLYLTEQERTAKMKIDEPKTPYAPHYDPAEDDEEMRMEDAKDTLIDAQGLMVDELDKSNNVHRKGMSEDDIPDLELGEPEEAHDEGENSIQDPRVFRQRSMSTESQKSAKHVHVGTGTNGDAVPGDDGLLTTEEAKEKHRLFENQRKRHYEMRNIKDLLAHPEDVDEMEEEEDRTEPGPPPSMPQMPERFRSSH